MSREVLPGRLAEPPAGRAALKVFVLTLIFAAPTGGAWFLRAPRPRWQVAASGVVNVGGNSEVFIAADAWFAMCGLVAGAICAVLGLLIARTDSPLILLALTAGGVVGALVAVRTGSYLGPAAIDVQAQALSVGDRFDGPLELSALGVLLAWPIASVAVYFSLLAGLGEPARRPPHPADALWGTTGIEPDHGLIAPTSRPQRGGRRRRPRA